MGDSHPRSSGRPSGEPSGGGTWRQYVKSGLLLLVGGVSLYLLLPTLVSVFSSWRSLLHLEWGFAVLVFACEAASYVWLWQLDRIALGTRAWFPIAPAQREREREWHAALSHADGRRGDIRFRRIRI